MTTNEKPAPGRHRANDRVRFSPRLARSAPRPLALFRGIVVVAAALTATVVVVWQVV